MIKISDGFKAPRKKDQDSKRVIRCRGSINSWIRELLEVMAPGPTATVLPVISAGARGYLQPCDGTPSIWRWICSSLQ